jgi:2'-5' RNA ligase
MAQQQELMRLFVALPLLANRELLRWQEQLRQCGSPLKVTPAAQLHLTLKFVGDTTVAEADRWSQFLAELPMPVSWPEQFILQGLGAFPRPQRPQVIWVGVTPAEPLQELAARCEEFAQQQGRPPEQRRFQPHITLARVRQAPTQKLSALLQQLQSASAGSWQPREVVLMQSRLTPRGPEYRAVHSVAMQPPGESADS